MRAKRIVVEAAKPLDGAAIRRAVDLIVHLEQVDDIARIVDVLR